MEYRLQIVRNISDNVAEEHDAGPLSNENLFKIFLKVTKSNNSI